MCPACLNKYNASVVICDDDSIQCPHCKYWTKYDDVIKFEDQLVQYYLNDNENKTGNI